MLALIHSEEPKRHDHLPNNASHLWFTKQLQSVLALMLHGFGRWSATDYIRCSKCAFRITKIPLLGYNCFLTLRCRSMTFQLYSIRLRSVDFGGHELNWYSVLGSWNISHQSSRLVTWSVAFYEDSIFSWENR